MISNLPCPIPTLSSPWDARDRKTRWSSRIRRTKGFPCFCRSSRSERFPHGSPLDIKDYWVAAHFSSLEPAPSVERQADRIADPVQRLRYLRRQMAAPRQPPRRAFKRPVMWMAMAVALVMIPGPIPTGTAETFARERRLLVPVEAPAPASRVWRVENSPTSELYSNGLRIDLTFAVSNRPRDVAPSGSFCREG